MEYFEHIARLVKHDVRVTFCAEICQKEFNMTFIPLFLKVTAHSSLRFLQPFHTLEVTRNSISQRRA